MSNNNLFQGIFVPTITPLKNNSIYEKGLDNIFSYLKSFQINCIWLLGSYGAFPLLSEEERDQVAEVGINKAKQLGMTVIVNVSSLDTATAVRLAMHAQKCGADAVASVVPFYYTKSHYKNINYFEYFKNIIASVQVPVFFYNNVKATGFKPDYNFFHEMIKLGISGFKSIGDYLEMSSQLRILKQQNNKQIYLSGSTSVHLQGHLLGADGVTSGVALALPKLVVNLQSALESNDLKEALRLQDLVLKSRNIMGRYVGRAIACYDVLKHKGVDAGTCRSPWIRMELFQAQEVINDLKTIEETV